MYAYTHMFLGNNNSDFKIEDIYIYSKSAVHKTVKAFGFKFSYLNLIYK